MVSCSVVASHQLGVATVKNTSASEQDPRGPQLNLPFASQRTDAVPVPETYAHRSGKHFGVEEGTSTGVVGIAAVLGKEIPVVIAGSN